MARGNIFTAVGARNRFLRIESLFLSRQKRARPVPGESPGRHSGGAWRRRVLFGEYHGVDDVQGAVGIHEDVARVQVFYAESLGSIIVASPALVASLIHKKFNLRPLCSAHCVDIGLGEQRTQSGLRFHKAFQSQRGFGKEEVVSQHPFKELPPGEVHDVDPVPFPNPPGGWVVGDVVFGAAHFALLPPKRLKALAVEEEALGARKLKEGGCLREADFGVYPSRDS